jgi:S-formylglutathione hydrolase FrmB
MALFHSHFFSETLGMQSQALVIIPQATSAQQIGAPSTAQKTKWPCLWLLHGMSDDHTIWSRNTSIERYAQQAGVAVVMPNAHRSYYTNMVHGGDYWTYITQELPALMRGFFPLSRQPEHNAVAGLSMGGYGAAKWLLQQPEMFCAGASLSGALDVASLYDQVKENLQNSLRMQTMSAIYGGISPKGTDNDLLHLLDHLSPASNLPPLLQICGTEDFLYSDNLTFKQRAEKVGYPLSYRETAGDHNWAFWDREIQTAFNWFARQGFGQPINPA